MTYVRQDGSRFPAVVPVTALRDAADTIIYISGYTEESAARKAGIDRGLPFLQKPFAAAELLRQVREAMDQAGKLAGESDSPGFPGYQVPPRWA